MPRRDPRAHAHTAAPAPAPLASSDTTDHRAHFSSASVVSVDTAPSANANAVTASVVVPARTGLGAGLPHSVGVVHGGVVMADVVSPAVVGGVPYHGHTVSAAVISVPQQTVAAAAVRLSRARVTAGRSGSAGALSLGASSVDSAATGGSTPAAGLPGSDGASHGAGAGAEEPPGGAGTVRRRPTKRSAVSAVGGTRFNRRASKRPRRVVVTFAADRDREGEKPFGGSASRRSESRLALLRAFEKCCKGQLHNAVALLRDFLDHPDMRPVVHRVTGGLASKEMLVHRAVVAGLKRKLHESPSCSTKDRIRRSAIADAALSNHGPGSDFPAVSMGKVAQVLGMRRATLQTWTQELARSAGGFIEKRKTRSDATPQHIKDLVRAFYKKNTRAAPDGVKYVMKRRNAETGKEQQHRVHWREVTFEKLFERFRETHSKVNKVGLSTFKKLCPWWVRAKTPKPTKAAKPSSQTTSATTSASVGAAAVAGAPGASSARASAAATPVVAAVVEPANASGGVLAHTTTSVTTSGRHGTAVVHVSPHHALSGGVLSPTLMPAPASGSAHLHRSGVQHQSPHQPPLGHTHTHHLHNASVVPPALPPSVPAHHVPPAVPGATVTPAKRAEV